MGTTVRMFLANSLNKTPTEDNAVSSVVIRKRSTKNAPPEAEHTIRMEINSRRFFFERQSSSFHFRLFVSYHSWSFAWGYEDDSKLPPVVHPLLGYRLGLSGWQFRLTNGVSAPQVIDSQNCERLLFDSGTHKVFRGCWKVPYTL